LDGLVKLTYLIENIPAKDRAHILHWGDVNGSYVTIDSADLNLPAPCERCGSIEHDTMNCPIPPDTSPEHERRKARQGGCCGEPTKAE
jgi:hypothetical protein